jgi:hypothetical protein
MDFFMAFDIDSITIIDIHSKYTLTGTLNRQQRTHNNERTTTTTTTTTALILILIRDSFRKRNDNYKSRRTP